jgi:hypothetical protein
MKISEAHIKQRAFFKSQHTKNIQFSKDSLIRFKAV